MEKRGRSSGCDKMIKGRVPMAAQKQNRAPTKTGEKEAMLAPTSPIQSNPIWRDASYVQHNSTRSVQPCALTLRNHQPGT